MNKITTLCASLLLVLALIGCATSPTGRRQFLLVSDAQVDAMGIKAFSELKTQKPISQDRKQQRFVTCITNLLTRHLPANYQGSWEAVVFNDDSANAFALPGRKIGVHTGMFSVAHSQDQLAAVIGHEIGHVIAKHSNERLSTNMVLNQGLDLVETFMSSDAETQKSIMGLLGLGAQVGVLLPFSRAQEAEADVYGQELMAKAGFNPEAAIQLWRNMAANSGGASQPEFMSTHPSSDTRITGLSQHLKKTEPLYQQALGSGYRPRCQ